MKAQVDQASVAAASAHDRAGKDYWHRAWGAEEFAPDIDPRATSIWAHRDQLFHRELQRLMGNAQGASLLELGCARSAWLPYFAREFGCRVSGLDYSDLVRLLSGCIWWLDRRIGPLPTGRITSGFIFTAARKPTA